MDWVNIAALLVAAKAMKADCLHKMGADGGINFHPVCADTMQLYELLTEIAEAVAAGLLVAIEAKIQLNDGFVECMSVASYAYWQRKYAPSEPIAPLYQDIPERHRVIHRFLAEETLISARSGKLI